MRTNSSSKSSGLKCTQGNLPTHMKCGGMSPRECNLLQQRSNYESYCTKCLFTALPYAETHYLIEELTVAQHEKRHLSERNGGVKLA